MSSLVKIVEVLAFIFLGLAFRTAKVFDDRDGELLRRFVIRFPIPVLVFFSMYEAERQAVAAIPTMVAALVLVSAALFVLGLACSRFVSGVGRKTAVHACATFGNYGWMGFGVCFVLLGAEGLRRSVFFVLLFWPVFYAFGFAIGLIHTRGRIGRLPIGAALKVALPVAGAMLSGLTLGLVGWELPELVEKAFRPFGQMVVPLVLFGAGLTLSVQRMRRSLAPALMASAVALIAGPLVGLGVAAALTRDPVSFKAIVIEAAMPVAALTSLLAETFEMDLDLVNTAIVVSTLLSLVTLPIVAALLGV